MVSILNDMFMNIYIYIYIYIYVYIKMFMIESMVTLCYKDKVKGKSTKVLETCMVHGKEIRFFYRGKGRIMHIAMHMKSMKRLPTQDVIYFIVQWYLKKMHDLLEVPFGASMIVRLFHQRFFHGPTMVNSG